MARRVREPSVLDKYTSAELKRRRILLENILKNWYQWAAYVEDEGLIFLNIKGEEWCFFDLLNGINALPPRQREAIQLMCIENLREVEAARRMGFKKWSTPVQQYRNLGLKKLLAYHEMKEEERGAGTKAWN